MSQDRDPQDVQIETVAHHRNGVGGTPFHVVMFSCREQGEQERHRMVGIVFHEPGQVAVLDRDQTAAGNVAFACGNSWRGDVYEPILRRAVRQSDGWEGRI